MADYGSAPNRYHDRRFNIEAIKILPGEYYVTGRPVVIVTVLGSCVSVCLYDRVAHVGGMNHFMLPDSHEGGVLSESARYGAYAMEILINNLIKAGAARNRLEAKVFGAGHVLDGLTHTDVGARNASFAMRYIENEGIRLQASDILGIYPRKVYFFPAEGRVLVKKLRALHNDTIAQRELEYETMLDKLKVEGSVDLF
ncbi:MULTISPECIES: chemoreceptor glutamine deamidase CheD [unclassified Uliginosibacterium]|uniref:chemoreceptor glutamine deamidase CheD n=1 Tax=unclassified Uliginosibacterium TaxID=2621521 RepID=UPI000C7ACD58|nr:MULTISPECIES: chemoreceptor glutamine deamidase CheD [unclassified Uliginosibacterium]MDO6387361.1 chemoreceptor glutamine deamidase CheD [Uliginosibacterium sp. 31-12]PLK47216.1 chemotaxis protein CheD [Uliginosibacterium sp. TH139]